MALTKINIEMEMEDTFQNGTKLDVDNLYDLLHRTASEEYNRQVSANRSEIRISMKSEPADVLQLSFGDIALSETITA